MILAIVILLVLSVVFYLVHRGYIQPPRLPVAGFLNAWALAISLGAAAVLLIIVLTRAYYT